MTTTHPDPHSCPARGFDLRTADEIEAERQLYRMRCEALGWVVLSMADAIDARDDCAEAGYFLSSANITEAIDRTDAATTARAAKALPA